VESCEGASAQHRDDIEGRGGRPPAASGVACARRSEEDVGVDHLHSDNRGKSGGRRGGAAETQDSRRGARRASAPGGRDHLGALASAAARHVEPAPPRIRSGSPGHCPRPPRHSPARKLGRHHAIRCASFPPPLLVIELISRLRWIDHITTLWLKIMQRVR
jgi:hypothetical protein